MKYLVTRQIFDDEPIEEIWVIEAKDPSELKKIFFKAHVGCSTADEEFPKDASPSDLNFKFNGAYEKDETYTFYHVDEEFHIEGLVRDGAALVDALKEKTRERVELDRKDRRYREYLRLKEEFEGEENE